MVIDEYLRILNIRGYHWVPYQGAKSAHRLVEQRIACWVRDETLKERKRFGRVVYRGLGESTQYLLAKQAFGRCSVCGAPCSFESSLVVESKRSIAPACSAECAWVEQDRLNELEGEAPRVTIAAFFASRIVRSGEELDESGIGSLFRSARMPRGSAVPGEGK